MTTQAIAETKIKLAYREKYISDATNERGLASPRGAYRGYYLAPRAAPDTWLRLRIDPFGSGTDKDQFAVYCDRTNGYSVSVRETSDVEIDCTGLFPVVGATEDWYVYIEATYTSSAPTTANYRVEKIDPRIANPEAVILGIIPMTLGDLAIDFDPLVDGTIVPLAGIYAERTVPAATARKAFADFVAGDELWGLIDGVARWNLGTGPDGRVFAEPTIETVTVAGATKFQLMGTYYVGKGAAGTGGKHFRLMSSNIYYNEPLTNANEEWIPAHTSMYRSDGITALTPSTDADAQGFYTNPWVRFSFAWTAGDVSFTGTLRVLAFKRKTLPELSNDPAYAFPVGDFEQGKHVGNVVAPGVVQTPSSLTAGDLQWQLFELLQAINERVETVHYNSTPGSWVLLWRSHHKTTDGSVTKQTSSIYFGDSGLALLHGCYIKISDGKVYAGTGTGDATMVRLADGTGGAVVVAVKVAPGAGSSWSIGASNWDHSFEVGSTGFPLYAAMHQFKGAPVRSFEGLEWLLTGLGSLPTMQNRIFADTGFTFPYEQTEALSGGTPQIRQYYSQEGWGISYNCSYDSGTFLWSMDIDTLHNAFLLRFDSLGVSLYRKKADWPVGVPPWSDFAWDSVQRFGSGTALTENVYACMEVSGDTYERIRFGWRGEVGPVILEGVGWDVCNFRVRYMVAPSVAGGDFTIDTPYWDGMGIGPPPKWLVSTADIYDIDNWGFRIYKVCPNGPYADGTPYGYDGAVIIET